jgi:hypothetical protein
MAGVVRATHARTHPIRIRASRSRQGSAEVRTARRVRRAFMRRSLARHVRLSPIPRATTARRACFHPAASRRHPRAEHRTARTSPCGHIAAPASRAASGAALISVRSRRDAALARSIGQRARLRAATLRRQPRAQLLAPRSSLSGRAAMPLSCGASDSAHISVRPHRGASLARNFWRRARLCPVAPRCRSRAEHRATGSSPSGRAAMPLPCGNSGAARISFRPRCDAARARRNQRG